MLTIVLGLSTALVYGFADFFGAIGSKRARPFFVSAFAAMGGLIVLSTVTLVGIGQAHFDETIIFWGFIGGLASAFGLSCLYAALAIGPISILSPLSALISAIVPAVVGIAQGDSFTWMGWLALALVLVAVVLVGFVPGDDVRLPSAKGLLLGVGAGVGIGVVLIALNQAALSPNAVASDLGAVIIIRAMNGGILLAAAAIMMLLKKASPKELKNLGAKFWAVVIAAGACDAAANVLFVNALASGSFTVVSVLTALYPSGTILLAYIVLKERIARTQLLGIVLALGASVLLSV